jgi:tagaturonate epimerase
MEMRMELEKFSIGIGDRFGPECAAQLRALQKAAADGLTIAPVWNKSHREHMLARTMPEDARKAADEAVRECGWKNPYYVDADHIGLAIVDPFIPFSNFFTIEMADCIGKPASSRATASFVSEMARYKGSIAIPGMQKRLEITDSALAGFAQKYLFAIEEAGKVYRHIAEKKGPDGFVTEVSADEAQTAQTPAELFLILAAASMEGIPVQTIAPKFTGAFLKGVNYVGDPKQFDLQFREFLAIIRFAVDTFSLPRNLKLSIHTGSDKFALYPLMHRAIKEMDTGIHLKTAGTTWLEELAGIIGSGGAGLVLGKEVYLKSYERYDELCAPYLAVINIDKNRLPTPQQVNAWDSQEFLRCLKHDESCPEYDPNLRQLLHIGFKVAAELPDFYKMLRECRPAIEENVTTNIYKRHIRPLFLG